SPREIGKRFAICAAGFLLIQTVFFGWLLAHGALTDWFEETLLWPYKFYPGSHSYSFADVFFPLRDQAVKILPVILLTILPLAVSSTKWKALGINPKVANTCLLIPTACYLSDRYWFLAIGGWYSTIIIANLVFGL